jgi:regulator of replication initiation timing
MKIPNIFKHLMPWLKKIEELEDLVETKTSTIMFLVETNQELTQKIEELTTTLSEELAGKQTEAGKISITQHAIHRYRERCNGIGTDDDIRKFLLKGILKHLGATDTLSDGKYSISKGIIAIIQDNSVVTVINTQMDKPKKIKRRK